jgi:hypothetical protein
VLSALALSTSTHAQPPGYRRIDVTFGHFSTAPELNNTFQIVGEVRQEDLDYLWPNVLDVRLDLYHYRNGVYQPAMGEHSVFAKTNGVYTRTLRFCCYVGSPLPADLVGDYRTDGWLSIRWLEYYCIPDFPDCIQNEQYACNRGNTHEFCEDTAFGTMN